MSRPSTDRMLRASTGLVSCLDTITLTGSLLAAWTNSAAGRACNPTREPITLRPLCDGRGCGSTSGRRGPGHHGLLLGLRGHPAPDRLGGDHAGAGHQDPDDDRHDALPITHRPPCGAREVARNAIDR